METYLNRYELAKGVNGESSAEEIKETKEHF
jgi:hypothetical protein